MVSTQDSESCDPSSNLGRTFIFWATGQKLVRARPGFEPGTSRTLSENHTPRPTSLWCPFCQLQLVLGAGAGGVVGCHLKSQIYWLGLVAQWIRHLTTNQGIAGSSPAKVKLFFAQLHRQNGPRARKIAPPGGLEPPTFRLTAERASQLRHGGPVCEV